MAQRVIDLDAAIRQLRERFDELSLYIIPGEVEDIDAAVRQVDEDLARLNERITTLGRIRAHINASLVVVSELSDGQIQQIREALSDLGEAIRQNQAFDRVVSIVNGVLNGAQALASFAERGSQPAPV